MARQITSESDLEGHKRGNQGVRDTAITWCGVFFLAVLTGILAVLSIVIMIFMISALAEYHAYLLQNKDKLFGLLQWVASHSIGVMFGATPFLILWQQRR